MYKAVVTDLDGTLLNSSHKVSEYSKKVIKKFVEKGYKFYIATGRLHASTKEIADSIGVKIPLITVNGTRILDENGNEIYNNTLSFETVKKIASLDYKSCGEDLLINGYFRNVWLVTDKKAEEYYRKERPDKPYFPNTVSEEEFMSKTFNKMHFIGNHESLLKLREKILKEIDEDLNVVFVGNTCLEIFNKDANKAKAAKFVLEKDGIKLSEAIAFGDSLNDYEMLKEVGKGFLMGNAIYLLKEMAPELEIIETNDNDGEAKKIEEIFGI
ncbi:Cof-type HAD-IIB family hydrolase [Streptobacillus moniliformis]|uniref:Cof-like hydrolase n=1 Tax=Streptobacillus moniliformis (strain ATCC 14647 / DSM 12112 / NCTC 10651 / 9901) TaxID=519441 RepID=D1AWH0_STRM9|nr:Cof-type HAD-IIB family hydrolase [Streptobacillus moniliformis]ACZ00646.1 Cof-like hydrolase [Streptobacillus moniliformis DSM 12112]AVL42943.1 Cof-type HAD-IIB family hydrolase [Streptobacillus moniliformis]SQA14226.1 HMP-PP phosphatase [Streptobacillus moniliformis]